MAAAVIEGNLRLRGAPGLTLTGAVVRLEDISVADAPSVVVAETRCPSSATSPSSLPYRLRLPAGSVQDDRQYTLSARAEARSEGQRRLLGTVQTYPWSADRASTTDLELQELD